VRAADGPHSVKELIARAKARPGKLNYGAGVITTRLAGYLFARLAGIEVQLIPYKGSAEVVQGLLTGAVDYIIDGVASSLPLIRGGKFRALAKLNSRPLPTLPDVPPLAVAAGMPALDDMSSWIAFVAPAGTPRAIIDKVSTLVNTFLKSDDGQAQLRKLGITPLGGTPEALQAHLDRERAKWGPIIKEANITLQ
jgi:tripartite-type tricarboxylate transporter receptor subunit TctC